MYIRRKVFSRIQDEYGEERLFSVKDIDASEAPITARKDIKESNKTARHESDNESRLEDKKDRRANGYMAKVVDDNKDARANFVENAKDRREKRNENAKDRREKRNENKADRRDSEENRMQKRTERGDMRLGHVENRMAERTKRINKVYDYALEDNANRREKGILSKVIADRNDTRAKILENAENRRENRYKRLDRRMQAKYGR